MITPPGASLAMDAEGNQLLAFRRCAERELAPLEAKGSLRMAVVVAEYGAEVLLVHNSWRLHWELPGGERHVDEPPRRAAERAFATKSGLAVPELDFVAVVTFRLVPDDRVEHAAIYRVSLGARADVNAFVPTDEVGGLRWWDLKEELPDSADLDLWIAQHALKR
ncbi:NUDIX hydrolase [Nocardioides sp.]|uniref:NUDIX hydrolase n=1 Tax=Nocardioides sp. TaxID=35761 RepID=UPI003D124F09